MLNPQLNQLYPVSLCPADDLWDTISLEKGEANISSLWRFSPAGGRQREAGRDFQSAKVLQTFEFCLAVPCLIPRSHCDTVFKGESGGKNC